MADPQAPDIASDVELPVERPHAGGIGVAAKDRLGEGRTQERFAGALIASANQSHLLLSPGMFQRPAQMRLDPGCTARMAVGDKAQHVVELVSALRTERRLNGLGGLYIQSTPFIEDQSA